MSIEPCKPGFTFYPEHTADHVVHLKLCELCGNWFTRDPKISMHAVCAECIVKLHQALVAQEKELKLQEEQKEINRCRRRGSEKRVVEKQKRTWAKWRAPLLKAFKERGEMTKTEIMDIVGIRIPAVVVYIRHAGFKLNTVRYVKKPGVGGRGIAIYALDQNAT